MYILQKILQNELKKIITIIRKKKEENERCI